MRGTRADGGAQVRCRHMTTPEVGRSQTRVLVADDEPDLRSLIAMVLTAESYDVCAVDNGSAVLAMAQSFRPDVVLLDVMMPGMDGLEVCRTLRRALTTSNMPIIMLTAKSTPADAVAGLRAGADDYLMKPFDPEELLARVATTVRRSADLRGASPLTGLPGNSEILRRLGYLVAREEQDFAFLHADLDNFKAFNDRYGFVRGDDAIQATASVLQDVARAHGVHLIGHIGGDDFAVIASAAQGLDVAEAAVSAFDRMAGGLYDPLDQARGWIEVADRLGVMHRYPVLTISLGVASSAQGRFSSVHEVSHAAAEVKALAKRDAGSSWQLDHRRRGEE